VLVGVRGAGKTTLLKRLSAEGHVTILRPSTTRLPRPDEADEYDFESDWGHTSLAWDISLGDHSYGMPKSELEKAKSQVCATVFEPSQLTTFETLRDDLEFPSVTVGLDTVPDVAEQAFRVSDDPERLMRPEQFAAAREVVTRCDIALSGNESVVTTAFLKILELIGSRGGILTKGDILPLIEASTLLKGGHPDQVQSASYDLRVGPQAWCQGSVIRLTEEKSFFQIPPYSYAIVSALERAALPPVVIARFDLKVGYFFDGIILSNGPQVDPGYKGALFCMLYNGSGKAKTIRLGNHFATIDFSTTRRVTRVYRQQHQFEDRLERFMREEALTSPGGAIVELIEEKISGVSRRIDNLTTNFWAIAAACIAVFVIAPTILVPIYWSQQERWEQSIDKVEENVRKMEQLLIQARSVQRPTASGTAGQAKAQSRIVRSRERTPIRPTAPR
jgi:deoxycytidine triphosphate deaminase